MSNMIIKTFDFGGVHVAEGIDENGDTVYAVLGDWDGEHGCTCPEHAPHEQLGALPQDIAARIDGGARR